MPLSVKNIALNLKVAGRYRDDGSGAVRGLYQQVSAPGTGSWVLRYQRGGKEHWHGLGSVSDLPLAKARKLANAARVMLAEGSDPITAKKAERVRRLTEAAAAEAVSVTFEQASMRYYKFHSPHWKNAKHRSQFLSSLETYAYPTIGALPVSTINLAMVLKVLEPIWQTMNPTASRVRNRIESVLDFARVNEWRPDIGTNPASWKGNLKQALPAPSDVTKVKHFAALSYDQAFDFMEALRQHQGIGVAALQFTVLTAARSSETIGARWDEMELHAGIPVTTRDADGAETIISGPCWVIPAARMKSDKPHSIPLSDRVVEILNGLAHVAGNQFCFVGGVHGKSISAMAMPEALARLEWSQHCTVHGMRSTFRDWASEVGRFDSAVVEMALHHSVGTAVERAYRRGDLFDKRRLLMDAWSTWCSTAKHTGDVVQLRGKVTSK